MLSWDDYARGTRSTEMIDGLSWRHRKCKGGFVSNCADMLGNFGKFLLVIFVFCTHIFIKAMNQLEFRKIEVFVCVYTFLLLPISPEQET